MLTRFNGRRLPMIDRVEIAIIEEQQPRWLAFLNRQQDFLERIGNEFINLAALNGKLAPNLQRQGIQLYRVLAADLTMNVYNMDDPVIGGYTDSDRVASCDQPGNQYATGNSTCAKKSGNPSAGTGHAKHRRL